MISPENDPSKRIAERNGYRYEGTLRSFTSSRTRGGTRRSGPGSRPIRDWGALSSGRAAGTRGRSIQPEAAVNPISAT